MPCKHAAVRGSGPVAAASPTVTELLSTSINQSTMWVVAGKERRSKLVYSGAVGFFFALLILWELELVLVSVENTCLSQHVFGNDMI